MFDVCCLLYCLVVASCSVFGVSCLVFRVLCLLFVVRCLLVVGCGLSAVVRCLVCCYVLRVVR